MVHSPQDLTNIFNGLWKNLNRGAIDSKSDYRWLNLSTIDKSGIASTRTVVLREAIKSERILRIFSDLRAKKIEHIKNNPCVTAHFHDRKKRIQLRMLGTAYLGNQKLTTIIKKKMYRAMQGPGELLENDEDYICYLDDDVHKFSVINIHVKEIDWLSLNNEQHLRIKFQCSNSEIKAERITP